ncbi:type II secretion system F family protein [Geoglobus acetivorans]|uniref:Type II secretion system F family protein n=1 Tax=Geoglobus acetivorans TaxID=565033 RepID=A0ABZ3H560_GEOAI|nr:type II secretion system F family protein [Geoglobus acetivorans]
MTLMQDRRSNSEDTFREKFTVYAPRPFVRYFRKRYERDRDRYHNLEKTLVSSRLPVTVPRYLAIATFYPLVLLPLYIVFSYSVAKVLGYYYASYTGGLSFLPVDIASYHEIPIRISFQKPDVFVFELIVLTAMTALLFILSRLAILYYPRLVLVQRRSKIESTLPHVVNIMLGMSKGGASLLEIIKTIAEERSITGEVGKEFSIIYREVSVFHRDLISAMRFVSNTTPSSKLSEFLEDMIGVVEGGGKVSEFLEFKSSHFIEERERYYEIFINTLEIFGEVYVAMFVVAPLFSLIVFILLGMMGGAESSFSKLIVYGYIPIGAVMFIWLINSMMKREEGGWVERVSTPLFIGAKIISVDRVSGYRSKGRLARLLKRLKSDLKKIFNIDLILRNPHYTFAATIPAALLFSAIVYGKLRIETLLVTVLLIVAIPYTILYEIRIVKLRKMENELPDLLKQLGSLNESGLTLVNALKVLSMSDLGALTREISNIRKDIEWGRLATEAFLRFEERVGSPVVGKVISILVKALEATDNVKAAIFTAATDAEMFLEFRKRVANEMFVYTVIVYVTFYVFLFTIVILNQNFIKVFSNITVPQSVSGVYFASLNVSETTTLFYHASLLNGLFSGLVAGVMGSGSLRSGIKHSIFMVVSALLVFVYFVGVGF